MNLSPDGVIGGRATPPRAPVKVGGIAPDVPDATVEAAATAVVASDAIATAAAVVVAVLAAAVVAAAAVVPAAVVVPFPKFVCGRNRGQRFIRVLIARCRV